MRSALLHSSAVPSFGLKEPVIAVRVAQAWLALGCIAVLCLPASRGYSEWIGWLPLWLVIMPAAQLAMLRWRLLASASRKSWRRLSHFHGESAPRRARRVRGSARVWRARRRTDALLTALLLR
ncbi:MAG: hypothetical protein JSS16_08455 [Proteobacteria bacterium]|uniref:hypothetical protein n=1 Tax=Rudaea sp. TaxID=2136325 RepID=UPI001D35EBC0|nr:hypothetical protein [Pseudomonadota bacterium]MBS0568396.1 hypothetical protein [Pseudomonadota bacterium]